MMVDNNKTVEIGSFRVLHKTIACNVSYFKFIFILKYDSYCMNSIDSKTVTKNQSLHFCIS